jgi:hypothetical protein
MTTTLIIFVAIIILFFVLNLLMGKEMKIERSVSINKASKPVFDHLKITKNQDNFSVWNMADPNMKKEYKGVDGQVGFVYKWESATNKNVGEGEQEITKIEEGKTIEYEVRFFRPMKNVAHVKFLITPESPDRTMVQWVFMSPTKFPMTLLKPLLQNMLGKDLEKGLVNLKANLEK